MPDQQKEKSDFLKDHPDITLNSWSEHETEVPVMTPVVDEKNKRVSFKMDTQKVKEKVFYASSTPRMVICNNHSFIPWNPKKYIFKCERCDYHFKANTLTHKYDPITKKILFRETLKPIM
jgi:hypothetical protein